jgi:hypothetical protein
MIDGIDYSQEETPINLNIKPIEQAEEALRLHVETNFVQYQPPTASITEHRARAEYLRIKELLEFELELARKSPATEWRTR